MHKSNLVGIHETRIAHHVAAIGQVDREHGAASILDCARAMIVQFLVVMGGKVATRQTVRGTQRGGLMGIPPTDRQVTFGAINTFRLADGKIVEQWVVSDQLGMMQQLGVIPAPGQAG